MLRVVEQKIREDKHIECCFSFRKMIGQRCGGSAPEVALCVLGNASSCIYTRMYVYKINQSVMECTYLSHQLRPLRQPLAMLNIIPQVLDKIRIRVVRHDYTPRAVDGRDETGETGASTELEHGFVFQEDIRVLLEVGGDGAAGVPEVVALVVA